jgi:hypothetical protein
MGLKDIGKIVANANAREAAMEEAHAPRTKGPQFNSQTFDVTKHEPTDVSGHRGFTFDSKNAIHKDLFDTLLKSGDSGKVVVGHPGGAISMPKDLAYREDIAKKFEVSAELAGGEKRYEGTTPKPSTAVTPAPRKSEKTSTKPGVRPAAPRPVRTAKPMSPVVAVANKLSNGDKEELRGIFSASNSRITPESIEIEKRKKAEAEAADKAARAEARRKHLEED